MPHSDFMKREALPDKSRIVLTKRFIKCFLALFEFTIGVYEIIVFTKMTVLCGGFVLLRGPCFTRATVLLCEVVLLSDITRFF